MQSNIESLQTLFRRIYGNAEEQQELVFQNDDNQRYLTHALTQSILYSTTEQDCVISLDATHCLNDGANATPMSLASFQKVVNIKTQNPITKQTINKETYHFYDCVTGTNTYHKPSFAAYKAQFDKAIELLSIDNPNLDALDIPQEVKDALRGLQFPIIKPYTLAEINAITEEESDNLNRLRLNDTNAVLESGKLWLIKLLSSEQIQALRQKAELNSFEQVLNLSEENPYLIRLLTLQEIQALTRDQIQALQPYQIWALEFRQIQALTKIQIRSLEFRQIQALTEIQIKSLTQRQIQALTEIQISFLIPVQIQALRENEALKTAEKVLEISKTKPWFITLLTEDEIQALKPEQIQALTTDQISWLKPEQIEALNHLQLRSLEPDQSKALVTHILAESYNKSDKSPKDFQAKLGEYGVLGTIKEQDIEKAFLSMKHVGQGADLTEAHIQTLESTRTWLEFIEQLTTSMGKAENDFRRFIKQQQQEGIGAPTRAA